MLPPSPSLNRPSCPVETTIRVIAGRWKVLILRELFSGPKRFSSLRTQLTGISHKILTQQLRSLEADGLIKRHSEPEFEADFPLKVEYLLTPLGWSLHPVLETMHQWGSDYLSQTDALDSHETNRSGYEGDHAWQ